MTASWTYQFDLSRQHKCLVSDDFTRIVFSSRPTNLIVIDAGTGEVLSEMMFQEKICDPVHISPDGSRFLRRRLMVNCICITSTGIAKFSI